MIGLNILLVALSIAVLALIPWVWRYFEHIPGLRGDIERMTGWIDANAARILDIERDMADLRADQAKSPEYAPIEPDLAAHAPIGTDISHFAAPDSPFDPMDGKIPYLDTNWQNPLHEDGGEDV